MYISAPQNFTRTFVADPKYSFFGKRKKKKKPRVKKKMAWIKPRWRGKGELVSFFSGIQVPTGVDEYWPERFGSKRFKIFNSFIPLSDFFLCFLPFLSLVCFNSLNSFAPKASNGGNGLVSPKPPSNRANFLTSLWKILHIPHRNQWCTAKKRQRLD